MGAGGRGVRRRVAASYGGLQGRVSNPSPAAQGCSGFAGQVGFEASCAWWHFCYTARRPRAACLPQAGCQRSPCRVKGVRLGLPVTFHATTVLHHPGA